MPYDEKLATRVRSLLPDKGVEEKKMMGGLTFMLNGKMCVGILKDEIMVRLDPELYRSALERKGCREMNFTGKPMKGFVFVGSEGISAKKDLEYWLGLAVSFNKKAKPSRKPGKGSRTNSKKGETRK
ncbi:MAG: TfoX/Sxy family protein [Leptospirales bacterium]|nr:TfoX/Sxy family protein [Leptospirales bacterium]